LLWPESSPTLSSTIEDYVNSGEASVIGWTSTTGFGSRSVSECSSISTTWRLDICRHSGDPCLAFLVASTSIWLIVANWTTSVLIYSRMGAERLQLGIHSLTISETSVFLHELLNGTLRPSFYSVPQCSHCKRCISYSNSVRPSVRLSVCYAGIVSKPLHVARCSLHCQIGKSV